MAISILPLLLLAGLASANQNLTSDQSESSIYITAKIAQYLKRPWNDQNFLLLIYLYTQMNHLIWVIKIWFIQIWVIYDSHLKWPRMTFNDMDKYFVQIKHTKIILLLFVFYESLLMTHHWWPSMCPVSPTRCSRFYDLAPGQFLNQTIMIFHQSLGEGLSLKVRTTGSWLRVGHIELAIFSKVGRVVIIDQIV